MPLLAVVITSTSLLYGFALAFYRLYFSPLSKFPGPKLAALTEWYEAYFNLFAKGGGQFVFELSRMHERYGPIVRIGPNELHIDDPSFYNELYSKSTSLRPIDRPERMRYVFPIPGSTFSTLHAEQHRERRAAVSPFFSKQRIMRLHDHLSAITERLSHRLSTEYAGTGRVLDITRMWASMTLDVVTELAFSHEVNASSAPDFESQLSRGISEVIFSSYWNIHFNFISKVIVGAPEDVLAFLFPSFKPLVDYRKLIRQRVEDILLGKSTKAVDASHPTIFHDILASTLPPQELTVSRLTDEAMTIVGAGFETTRWTLSVAVFHVLEQPDVQTRLKAELAEAMPDPTKILAWNELEKMPYLSGVVSESLRVSFGAVQRFSRINRLHPVTYGDLEIPAGVAVGMDSHHMHNNAEIFPDPSAFRPERWLGNPQGPGGKHPLSNYLVSFGRGCRMCLGINLALMEIYVGLATVFRRHELKLFETDSSDVDMAFDLVVPMPKRDTKGIRVTVSK